MIFNIKIKTLFSWHRYMGLAVAVFVLILSATGLLLNHTEEFELDSNYVQSDWLLNLYNIKPPQDIRAFKVKNIWVSQFLNTIYLGTAKVEFDHESANVKLIGAVITGEYLVIATTANLILFTSQGELVETVSSAHGLPTPLEQIGLSRDDKLVVLTTQGIYRADIDELSWTDFSSSKIDWSTQAILPDALFTRIAAIYRGQDLNYERIVLDLHSGRILPRLGIYIMDSAAILMMLLAISGIWVWYLKRRKRSNN